jgi:RNA polymerase sigma-70 factor (ECF subfamily)
MEPRTERLQRLIEPVHDRALGFARCLCRSRADGDDLYQEALVRALTKLDALREDAAFRPWLYRIIVSVHRNRSRRAFWRRWLPLVDHAHGDVDAAPAMLDYRSTDWSPDAASATLRARAALARLSAREREAIVLFEIEGWQVDEIAALHRVSSSAIKSRLARGRERMRAFYDREQVAAVTPAIIRGETR